jgi:hypothetical protein
MAKQPKETKTRNAPRTERTQQRPDDREAKLNKKRKNRVKVEAGFRSKLSVPAGLVEPGMVPRWVNDDANRIPDMKSRGWEYVENKGMDIGDDLSGGNVDIGNRVGVFAGTKANGEPLITYLMQIEEELYNEDAEAKQAAINETESQITGKNKTKEEAKAGGSTEYGEAKIEHNLSA